MCSRSRVTGTSITWGQGVLDVFANTLEGEVIHWFQDGGHGLTSVDPRLATIQGTDTIPLFAGPAAVAEKSQHLDVVAIGNDGADLLHWFYRP